MPVNKATMLALMMLLMGLATPAMAQDDSGEPVEAGEEGEGAGTPLPSNGEEFGTGSIEGDLDLYWGGKRKVEVVQKRLFNKDGRMEFSLFGGIIPNDPFVTYIPVGGRFNYYFLESISLEVAGSYVGPGLQIDSDLSTFLKNEDKIQANVELLDVQQWRAGAGVSWSPFYGKMAFLQRKLSHFDISLTTGFGVVQLESPPEDGVGDPETPLRVEGHFGAGFRFFLTESVTLRVDYRQFIFQKTNNGVATPSEITFGVSFFTGG